MAHKATSFKVDNSKKTITIYTNVTQPEAETNLISFYLTQGYEVKMDEKKPAKTVAQMRAELKGDEESLKEFNRLYGEKTNKNAFFDACKYYNQWKKANK